METLIQYLFLAPVIIISLTVHEVAHGYIAKLLGDETAARQGRLSLNPIRHLDPLGTILLFTPAHFGWAKPVPINPLYFRGDRNRGILFVSLAGPMSNFILSVLSATVIKIFLITNYQNVIINTFLIYMIIINVSLGVFNLIPIPPLDGSKILASLLPPEKRNSIYQLERYGPLLLILLLWFDGNFIDPIRSAFIHLEELIFNIRII